MNLCDVIKNAPDNATHFKNGYYYASYKGGSFLRGATVQTYIFKDGMWKSIGNFNGFDDSFIQIKFRCLFNNVFESPAPNNVFY